MPPVYNKWFCSNGASPCQAETFSVLSLFGKVIFCIEKHLYDVLKKCAYYLEMSEIRADTPLHLARLVR